MAEAKIDTKEAVAEINKLIQSFNLLIKATGDVSTISKTNFRKVETALEGLRTVSKGVEASFNKMTASQQKATIAATNEALALAKQNTELSKSIIKANEASKAQEKLAKSTKGTTSTFSGLLGGTKALIGAFGLVSGIQMFASIVKDAFSLTKQFDSLSFALKTIVKDSFDAASSQRFMLEITQDFGVELVATTTRWIKFLAAAKQSGVTLKDTEQIFRSVTKAGAVLGLQTDELSTVYLALEQMMSKGKVTTEELRRQLGEKLPGAVGIMAAAIGVGVEELDALLKKGEVLSAVALPKFARALESAYGIETLEKIETLVSEQNNLTNAWELFVKSVVEGKGAIAGALNVVGMSLKGFLHFITPNEILEQQKFDETVISNRKKVSKQLIIDAKEALNAKLEIGKKYDDVDKAYTEKLLAYQQAVSSGNKKAADELQKSMAKELAIRTSYDEQIEASIKVRSISSLKTAQERYDATTREVNFFKAQKVEMEKWSLNYEEITKKFGKLRSVDQLNDLISKANAKRAAAASLLEVYKLNSELSREGVFEKDDEKKGRKPGKFNLSDVKDLSNERRILELDSQKELNSELLAGDKASIEERQAAAMSNVDIELEISQLKYDEAIEQANLYYEDEIEKRNQAVKDGKTIIGDEVEWELALKKNYADKLSMATINKNKAVLDIEEKFGKEQLAILKLIEEKKISDIELFTDKRIIAAKEEYEASKKTAEDKKKLDDALADYAVTKANLIIDIQVKTLEAMLEAGDLTEAQTDRIIKQIAKLNAARQSLVKNDAESIDTWVSRHKNILEEISKFSDEITNLGSAIFDRRIENINAEIKAEEDKYDYLIGLAKNNKDEQERLQVEKEAKTKELEKARLKEEQKKAKFQKANALIQIAINTATAASETIVASPLTGGMPWLAFVIALGAIQAATVLAQPIPQYKGGLFNSPNDHIGMINDGGKKEYIERDGNILSTSTKNAIVQLKKGDTVHKSYDDMVSNSDIFNNISRSMLLNGLYSKSMNSKNDVSALELVFDKHLNKLDKDIKKGIHDGFNKVTINNVTKIDVDWINYKNNTL